MTPYAQLPTHKPEEYIRIVGLSQEDFLHLKNKSPSIRWQDGDGKTPRHYQNSVFSLSMSTADAKFSELSKMFIEVSTRITRWHGF